MAKASRAWIVLWGVFAGCTPSSTCEEGCDAGGRPSIELCARIEGRRRVCRAPEEALDLDLGEVELGGRAAVVVEVSSEGDVPATLEDVRLVVGDGWSIEGDDTPLTLAPGAQARFTVALDASTRGPASASVAFDLGEIGEGVLRVQVRANVVHACRPVLDPVEHDFGAVDVGEGLPLALVLSNEGGSACTIVAPPSVTGPVASHFEFVDLPAAGTPLVPGARLPFTVRFKPAARLERFAAELRVGLSDPDDLPLSVSSTVRGSSQVEPACRLLSPTLAVGELEAFERREVAATLQNEGDGPCTLASWRVVGPASPVLSPVGSMPTTLAPGSSVRARWQAWGTVPFDFAAANRTVVLVQSNDAAGHAAAECLSFDASARAGCVRIDVTGRSVVAGLQLAPQPLDAGAWFTECRSEPFAVTIRNATAGQLTVSGLTIGSPFEFVSGAAEVLLGSSRTLDLTLRGLPAATGSYDALLQASGNATGGGAREYAWPVTGRTEPRPALTRVTLEPIRESLDLLYGIYNSGSMAARQAALAEAIPTFVTSLDASGRSWHAGVVTTDLRQGGVLRGTPSIITPRTEAGAQLAERVRQGTNGSADERGLETMRLALVEPAASGANAGFRRPGADLRVVVFTDELDSSDGSPESYASFLGGVTRAPFTAELWAIAEAADGRYARVAGATGGEWTSIVAVSGSYVSFLGSMLLDVPRRGVRCALPQAVDAGTLRVRVAGSLVPASAWTFDAMAGEIVFATTSWPTRDDLIEAEFRPACP